MQISLNLQIPHKLAPLYEPKRYKVMHGGRGGGKSHSVAQVLLDLGARKQLRILCAREIQKSMRDSVHRLLKDYIIKLGLTAFYEITDTEIRGANGTLILFAGLQAHTVDSIKSFEGVDIVWVEEAHSVSKKSWDVLTPTIRKEGSEIWMTLNPDMETDETYVRFVAAGTTPDTWVAEINWRDNPWFPVVLNDERKKAKREMSAEDYEHIWEGKARTVAAGAIYRHEILDLYARNRVQRIPYDPLLPVHTVWDLGWNDSMTILFVQKGPADIRIIDYIEDSHRTLDWYVTKIEKMPFRWGADYIPHDGRTKNFQTGKSTEELLRQMGRNPFVLAVTGIEEGIKMARMIFPKCYFDETSTRRLVECLKRYSRRIHEKTGEPMGPLHDEYSHGADAFRYLGQAVELMRNDLGQTDYQEAPAADWRL